MLKMNCKHRTREISDGVIFLEEFLKVGTLDLFKASFIARRGMSGRSMSVIFLPSRSFTVASIRARTSLGAAQTSAHRGRCPAGCTQLPIPVRMGIRW